MFTSLALLLATFAGTDWRALDREVPTGDTGNETTATNQTGALEACGALEIADVAAERLGGDKLRRASLSVPERWLECSNGTPCNGLTADRRQATPHFGHSNSLE